MPKEYVDDVLTGLGEAQPPEAAHGLTDDSYVLIPPKDIRMAFAPGIAPTALLLICAEPIKN